MRKRAGSRQLTCIGKRDFLDIPFRKQQFRDRTSRKARFEPRWRISGGCVPCRKPLPEYLENPLAEAGNRRKPLPFCAICLAV